MAGVVGRAELTSALCFFGAFLTYAQCCKTGIDTVSIYRCNSIGERGSYIISIRLHAPGAMQYVETTMQGRI